MVRALLFLNLFLGMNAIAVNLPAGRAATMAILGSSAQPLGPTYGHPYTSVTASGVSRFQVYNKSSSDLGVSVTCNTCATTCADNFVVPASNQGNTIEYTAIGKVICLRTLSGGSASGTSIFVSRW